MLITNAFTCTGPYAILIMLGIKRVENRSMMPSPAKGRCAVGCSKSFCKEEFGAFVQWASQVLPSDQFALIPAWSDVEEWPGKIVGACDYLARGRDDLVLEDEVRTRGSASLPWDEGYGYWWELSGVVAFERPIPCRGNVGMWQMPTALSAAVSAADVLGRAEGEKVASAEDAVRIFKAAIPVVKDAEGVFVLPLDDSRRVISAPILVSLGDHRTAAVQVGEVFASALKVDAKAVIVAHNHPSGDPTASVQDKILTDELMRLGTTLGVEVLDHLIIAGDKMMSCMARK